MRLRSLAPAVLVAVVAPVLPLSSAAAAEPGGVRSTEGICPAAAVPEDGFRDVSAGSPHEPAVDCVVWWKIAQGVSSVGYRPTAGVSRAAMTSSCRPAATASATTTTRRSSPTSTRSPRPV